MLPVAIDRGVWVAARRVAGDSRVASEGIDAGRVHRISSDAPAWAQLFREAWSSLDAPEGGLQVGLVSDLPVGMGLSSSAASVTGFLCAARGLYPELGRPEALTLAEDARAAERGGLGVRCGLMDPLVCAAGRAGRVLDLDCRTGAFEQLVLDRSKVAIVVTLTPAKRALAGSAYNARRAGCEAVVRAAQARFPSVATLRDLRLGQLDALPLEAEPRRWARHVLGEMARVELGRRALLAEDFEAFGGLMYGSHVSLRDLYEVSHGMLDQNIEACRAAPESFGGRLTGAGFGGCTVHLVQRARAADFAARFTAADVVEAVDGACARPGLTPAEAAR